jgi:hypothetical protein
MSVKDASLHGLAGCRWDLELVGTRIFGRTPSQCLVPDGGFSVQQPRQTGSPPAQLRKAEITLGRAPIAGICPFLQRHRELMIHGLVLNGGLCLDADIGRKTTG